MIARRPPAAAAHVLARATTSPAAAPPARAPSHILPLSAWPQAHDRMASFVDHCERLQRRHFDARLRAVRAQVKKARDFYLAHRLAEWRAHARARANARGVLSGWQDRVRRAASGVKSFLLLCALCPGAAGSWLTS